MVLGSDKSRSSEDNTEVVKIEEIYFKEYKTTPVKIEEDIPKEELLEVGAVQLIDNVYFNGDYDRNALIDNLGTRFEGINVSFKPWPSARHTHPFVDATLDIVRQQDIHPEEVTEIVTSYGKLSQGFSQPLESLQNPRTMMDAKTSSLFTVAIAVAKRNIVLRDFTKEGRNDPIVLERGSTLEDAAAEVHKDFRAGMKYARIWGSGKHDGVMAKRDHILQDGDIIELHL